MIVICINDCFLNEDTKKYAEKFNIPVGDWQPILENLYEVIEHGVITLKDDSATFYRLREDPKRGARVWRANHFREVDVDISTLEKVEELELTS